MPLLSMYDYSSGGLSALSSTKASQAFILAESGYDCPCEKPLDLQGNCANMVEWTECYNG